MTKKIIERLKIYLLILIICSVVFGTIYLAVQQNYRQSANDPQIQMAEDEARALENGQKVDYVSSLPKIDLSYSLAPFLIIYDSQGNPATSSAILNGRIPVPPPGVFDVANNQTENRLTWQPTADVRIAAVIVPFHAQSSGYVLAGRSLKEVEKRENELELQVGAGFISTIILGFFALINKNEKR